LRASDDHAFAAVAAEIGPTLAASRFA